MFLCNEKNFRAKNARGAVHLLTDKTFGFQYSAKYLEYYFSKNYGVGNFHSLGLIGSDDSEFHKGFSFYSRMKAGGWMNSHRVSIYIISIYILLYILCVIFICSDYFQIQGSVSSVKQLYDLIKAKLTGEAPHTGPSGVKGSLTAADIAKALNIKNGNFQEAIEGNLFFKLLSQERVYTFGENGGQNLDSLIKKAMERLRKGLRYDYNNFFNEENVDIGFPTVTGMPFFLRSKIPTYINLKGNTDFKFSEHPSASNNFLNITGNTHFVLANDFDGRVGFYCPLGEKYMTSGIINKFQLNIPISYKVNIDMYRQKMSLDVSPLYPQQETNLYYDSRDSYTTVTDRNSMEVPSQNDKTHFIKPPQPKYKIHSSYGKDTVGMTFEVKAIYDVEPKQRPLSHTIKDSIIALFYPNFAKDYSNGAKSIKFMPKDSPNNRATFFFDYCKYFNIYKFHQSM